MKKTDVPQDDSSLKSKDFKELCYAVNEEGDYVTAKSTGWDPKTIALDNAIHDINERIALAKSKVLAKELSPIVYYMECHKMDLIILASYVGLWRWRVKRHFKPHIFDKLSTKLLQKYADVFEISITQLKNIDYEN
jgi:hypothetical protein